MDAKLTLKLDAEVISKAKEFAKKNENSLSRIIENYLKTLTQLSEKDSDQIKITERVKRMTTMAKKPLPPDFDYKKELADGLYEDYIKLK